MKSSTRTQRFRARSIRVLPVLAGLMLHPAAHGQVAGNGDTAAIEPKEFNLLGSISETYDDNVARSSAGTPALSDWLTHAEAGGSFQRGYGQQTIQVSGTVGRTVFANNAVEDYDAFNWLVSGASEFGRDGRLGASLQQTMGLMPVENFQTLIRDVVTQRVLSLTAGKDIGAYLRFEAIGQHTWQTNDNPLYTSSDNQSNSGSLGLALRPSQQTYFGARVGFLNTFFATELTPAIAALQPQPAFAVPLAAPVRADFHEFEISPYFSWTPDDGITVNGNLSEVTRHYDSQPGQAVRSLFGTGTIDYDRKGRLSGGVGIHRELGGQTVLASRFVETDGANLHARYQLLALTSLQAQYSVDRRRYSVDEPGYPAHREYENTFSLSAVRELQRSLSLALNYTGDWRHADPAVFGFIDHRVMLRLDYDTGKP